MWSAKKVPALLTGILVLCAVASPRPVLAARDDDSSEFGEDLYDFTQDRMMNLEDDRRQTRSDLIDEIKELKQQRAELKGKKEDKDQIKDIKKQIEQLEGEKAYLNRLKTEAFGQINSDSRVTTKILPNVQDMDLGKAEKDHNAQLDQEFAAQAAKWKADAGTSPEVKRALGNLNRDGFEKFASNAQGANVLSKLQEDWKKQADAKPLEVEKIIELKDSPFDLVAKVEKTGDKWSLKYDLKVRDNLSSLSEKALPSSIRKKFKNESEIHDFLDKQVRPLVNSKSVDIDLKGKDLNDPASKRAIEDALKRAVDTSHNELLFGKADAALRSGIKDKLEERYGTSDTSEVSQKKDELKEAQNGEGKREDIAELEAKQRIAEWLRSNDPGKKTACEVIADVFKLKESESGWKKLPSKTQQQCAEYSPEERARVAHEEKTKKDEARKLAEAAKESEPSDESGSNPAASEADAQFRQLVQYCLGYYRNMGAQSGMKSIVDTVGPIYNALEKQGLGCKTYARFMGELSDPNMLSFMPPNALQEKAFEIVHPTDDEGRPLQPLTREELKKELKCLDSMVTMAGGSLGMVMGKAGELSPMGLQDPNIQKDPKLQQLYRMFQAATELQAAVRGEIGARGEINQSRFRAVGPNGQGGAGAPVVGPPGSVGVDAGAGAVGSTRGDPAATTDAARERRGLAPLSPGPTSGSGSTTRPRH